MVELLCSLCISGGLVAGTVPGLREFHQGETLRSVAAVLETDLQYARSLARTQDRSVRLALQTPEDGGACYVIHSGPAGACTCDAQGVARCTGEAEALRVQPLLASAGVRINAGSRSIVFDAGKGTVTPTATFVLADSQGRAVHQVVNVLGRIRSCSPSGLSGYRRCS
ncbi:GspH/FimT family pseudopilin [Aquabacterium sp. OR-4]|uniref:GspH/FimT family pseudopilin n=1 Tax=Aquabacterium sp. OR-4 TaxID=2978127 RepID=UPI0021B3B7DC|nr:GspH/FimT family pseudopilin [Aquabacterium sp. OR-4]MDT7836348.1 GspH/FimT family pseudopilin [Aquabacterium sp. OR-4]